MTVIVIIQARLGSTRFPRKVLADLCGIPLIAHVVARAQQIPNADGVVLAVPEDDEETFSSLGLPIPVVAYTENGDEDDVLSRFAAVADVYPADIYCRLTGDCPVLRPDVAAKVIQAAIDSHGYASNDVDRSGYADGEDAEAFPRALLLRADAEAVTRYDREHVGPWMARQGEVLVCNPALKWAPPKLSVDTVEDLARVRGIIAHEHVKHIH